jgi:hypothetical protein
MGNGGLKENNRNAGNAGTAEERERLRQELDQWKRQKEAEKAKEKEARLKEQ